MHARTNGRLLEPKLLEKNGSVCRRRLAVESRSGGSAASHHVWLALVT